MRKWSCTRRMVEIKCCGTIRRLRCFFSSSRVGSATHRHYWKTQDRASQHKEEMPDRPAWKLSIPFELPARWMRWKRRGEKERRNRGTERKRERKKESSVHTHTHTYTLNSVRCVISEMANENGERRLWSRNGIACPTSRKITLWISAWLAEKKKRKKRDDTNYRDDRWRMINSWATPVPEHVGGQLNERNSLRENCNAYFRDKTHWTRNGSFVLSWRWIWNLGKETFLAME